MRVLILTCNTGGGHNAVAAALAESFRRLGVSSDTADGLSFISQKASRFVSKWHTRFYRRYPKLYKAGYMSAENDAESNDRDNPVYRYMTRGARRLDRAIQDGGYDAVVCVHVIPAMMMTELRRQHETGPVFCFVATDYTCSPTVGGCTPDICVIPHEELAEEFVSCGIARETLLAAGDFASVLCGSNRQMLYALRRRGFRRVEAVGFTNRVHRYMDSADVLVSKPGGISITEAGTRGTPLLLADMVGGCETRNQEFFHARGWAETCQPEDMADAALALLDRPERRQALVAQQHRDFDGLAADRVAQAVYDRCRGGEAAKA